MKHRLKWAAPLLAALLFCGGTTVPNIYGTTVQMRTATPVDQQFASIYLPQPDDLTVQLGDGDTPAIVRWDVSYGSGGTSRQLLLDNAVTGTILHVVANTVVVRGTLALGSVLPGGRVTATVGLGTPAEVRLRQYVGTVDAAGFIDLPLPAFVSRVQLRGENAALTVQPRLRYGGANNSVGMTLPLSDYAIAGSFNANANTLRILNPGGAPYRYEATFYAMT